MKARARSPAGPGERGPAPPGTTSTSSCTNTGPGVASTAGIAAVPAESQDYAYVSSGTWSLMGVESPHPVVNETALALNVTNEGGVCDTIRFRS